MSNWLEKLRGRFLVFDGPDGCGKSTQLSRFADHVEAAGIEVCYVRDPGGTTIGEQIRTLLLDPHHDEPIDIHCEMLLFMASRAQLITQRIAPALAHNKLVLADRFISSTLAYQGAAGGLVLDDIMRVGQVALGAHWPDLCVVFDVDEATAATRLNPLLDRMERLGAIFHRRVRQGYLDQAKNDPQRYMVIDARSDENVVFTQLLTCLQQKI